MINSLNRSENCSGYHALKIFFPQEDTSSFFSTGSFTTGMISHLNKI
jgi:hypothetical protein